MAMTITVGDGNPGAVLIVIPGADLTDGEAWTLYGSAGNESWRVRGGSGTGDGVSQVALVDPMCPVNVTVTYTLTVGATTATDTVTRAYTGVSDIISSLAGAAVVHTVRTSRGGDPRRSTRRFHVSEVPGSEFPPTRVSPIAGAGGGAVQIITDSDNSAAMESLMRTNAPVILLHNHSGCVTGCTAKATQVILVTDDGNDVIGGYDTSQRIWDLSYLLISDPEPDFVVPLSTWDEFDAAYAADDWDGFDTYWSTRDWDEFDITDWTTVGA